MNTREIHATFFWTRSSVNSFEGSAVAALSPDSFWETIFIDMAESERVSLELPKKDEPMFTCLLK